MKAGHVGTRIAASLAPGRKKLAECMRDLYGCLGARTIPEAARRIASYGYETDATQISRYLNGRRLPPESFVRCLHRAAVGEAGAVAVGVSEYELVQLRRQAEPTHCGRCAQLSARCEHLQEENNRLEAEAARVREEAAQQGTAVLPGQARAQAARTGDSLAGGGEGLVGGRSRITPLPVPPRKGDRQRSVIASVAARQLASRAAELHESGDISAVVALLSASTEVLSPLEQAAALVLLREQERGQIADTLIHFLARGRSEGVIAQAALGLFDFGLPDEAEALLRVAYGAEADTQSGSAPGRLNVSPG